MVVVQGLYVIPTRTHLPVVSVCATQAAAVVAQRGKPAMGMQIPIPVVSAAATRRVAAAVMQDLSATVTLPHQGVVSARLLSAEAVHLVSCVIQPLASVCATIPVAAVVQRVPRATPMRTLKPVANVCVTRAAAASAPRVQCATPIRTPRVAACAEWTQRAVLKAIAIRIAAPVPMNPFAPV